MFTDMLAAMLIVTGNYIEAGVWFFIACILAVYALQHDGLVRRRSWQTAAVIFVFGLSDVVEAQTGAWWDPWWLFVWKAACVIALAALLLDAWHRRSKRRG